MNTTTHAQFGYVNLHSSGRGPEIRSLRRRPHADTPFDFDTSPAVNKIDSFHGIPQGKYSRGLDPEAPLRPRIIVSRLDALSYSSTTRRKRRRAARTSARLNPSPARVFERWASPANTDQGDCRLVSHHSHHLATQPPLNHDAAPGYPLRRLPVCLGGSRRQTAHLHRDC